MPGRGRPLRGNESDCMTDGTGSTAGSADGGTMKDVYDAVSNEDGEDAYLGDGMWIRSDGSTYDA
jgi:hypothetical protein